jgi:hypothetical protein
MHRPRYRIEIWHHEKWIFNPDKFYWDIERAVEHMKDTLKQCPSAKLRLVNVWTRRVLLQLPHTPPPDLAGGQ